VTRRKSSTQSTCTGGRLGAFAVSVCVDLVMEVNVVWGEEDRGEILVHWPLFLHSLSFSTLPAVAFPLGF
jgi:hypothetical protein